MQYYTRRKNHKYISFLVILIFIIVVLNIIIVFFDKRVMPAITEMAGIMAKSQTLNIINEKSVEILSKEFDYDQMIKIQKNNEGNIILVQADTIKLNYLAAKLSTECNKELSDMKNSEVKVPLGWLSDKSIFYNLGPKIAIGIEPMGNMSTSYESKFESAGINQTRHKIYLNVNAKIRLKLPMRNQDIEVTTQVPVSDTIIVGKTPNNTLGFPTNDNSKSQNTN
ncbi:sporulation protein YunB [Clostridium chromiireducens]|uniref:Sporulation protein YunB n=1 Tax=Clostridium chromiireducens TaxID=225345 RepID=A0A1V4I6A1_9CLOT|nr:sporulation protein YunB [Clostridium chromiireducens]OPJ55496.1 sporulation protein YunB [Clostridium chromiireducens]